MAPGAARLVLEQGLPGPIFNDYLTGAYLGAELHPRQRVFVDGRVLDPGLVVRYTRMVQSEEVWRRAEQEFGFRTVILGNYSKTVRSPLGNALMRDPPAPSSRWSRANAAPATWFCAPSPRRWRIAPSPTATVLTIPRWSRSTRPYCANPATAARRSRSWSER